MALGLLDCGEAIVLRAGFLDGLYHCEVGPASTLRAAKGLAAIVDFLKAPDAQRGIAPAYAAPTWRRMSCAVRGRCRVYGAMRRSRPTTTPQPRESPYVSGDSTLRHAGAQQCMHLGGQRSPTWGRKVAGLVGLAFK